MCRNGLLNRGTWLALGRGRRGNGAWAVDVTDSELKLAHPGMRSAGHGDGDTESLGSGT